jgi:acyl-CoA thioester hydrolase
MVEVPVRVRFAETDQMGVVHHSAYVIYLEQARVEWLRHYQLSYRTLEAEGLSLAVSQLTLEYRSAAYFDDLLLIETRLFELKSRRVIFDYTVRRPSDTQVIALGKSWHVPTASNGKSQRLPERYLQALTPHVSA